ncbi:MAG: septum formation initiator family protein [Gammaproteobacteria bacterium]|nr:septum formation initiator family protein [Gammaproteobacteria bacterium]MBU1724042.1 septum formation initiator family protein [Gammaproteobacteria bacterium]MBU2006889.1 septum formation initiator family protein [Gammaproteobacteria bacterium]
MNMTRILFWILGLLVLGLFFRLWVGPGSYTDIWRLQEKIEDQQVQNDEQAEKKLRLQMDVNNLSSEDAAVESHARSELGMVKKGETFYQVILKSDPKAPSTVQEQPAKAPPYVE